MKQHRVNVIGCNISRIAENCFIPYFRRIVLNEKRTKLIQKFRILHIILYQMSEKLQLLDIFKIFLISTSHRSGKLHNKILWSIHKFPLLHKQLYQTKNPEIKEISSQKYLSFQNPLFLSTFLQLARQLKYLILSLKEKICFFHHYLLFLPFNFSSFYHRGIL